MWGSNGTRRAAKARSTIDRNRAPRLFPPTPVEKAFDLLLQFHEGSLHRLAPRIDNDRPPRTQVFQVQPHRFPHTPLDAVARRGLAQRARQGKADARTAVLRLAHAKGGKQRPREARATIVHSAEIGGSQQTNTFRKAWDSLPLFADGQLVPPPCTAARQHGPSVLSLHAGAESVRLRAPVSVRLKGTFRHLNPKLFSIVRSVAIGQTRPRHQSAAFALARPWRAPPG